MIPEGIYRAPLDVPEAIPEAAKELLYLPTGDVRSSTPFRAFMWRTVAAAPVSSALTFMVGVVPALAALGVGASWGAWAWWRARSSAGTLLRIDDDKLLIVRPRATPVVIPLARLLDVVAEPRGEDVPPAGSLHRAWSDSVSRVRSAPIALVVDGEDSPVRLSDEHLEASPASEWIARIRRFLRAHGWRPQDERETEVA